MKCLKVLHFGLGPNRGGIETYLQKISSRVNPDKFHFTFLHSSPDPCFKNELTQLGCDFKKVTPRSKSVKKNSKEVNHIISEGDYDILHCHINTLSYITPVLSALKHNVPVIVHSRNAGTGGSLFTKIMHKINQYRLPLNKINKIAVSQEAGEWLFGRNTDFEVYNNGIDLDTFRFNENGRKNVRNEFSIEDDEIVFGNVGAFLPAKNQAFVIEIFANILQHNKESRLLLIGEGSLKQNAVEKARELGVEEKVHFAGKRSDMPELYSAMDVMLFPSFYEGFPNTILEAQACGLPCLMSDVITKEVVIRQNCHQASLNLDAKQWADKAFQMTSPENDRKTAWNEVENAGFSVQQEIARLENLYSKVSV